MSGDYSSTEKAPNQMYLGTMLQDIFASVERAEQTKHVPTTSEEIELAMGCLLSSTENQESNLRSEEVRSNGSQSSVLVRAARAESGNPETAERNTLRSPA